MWDAPRSSRMYTSGNKRVESSATSQDLHPCTWNSPYLARRTRMSACSGGTRQFYMPTQELDIQSESGHKIIDTPGRYRLHGRLTLPMPRGRHRCRSVDFYARDNDDDDDDGGRDVECHPLESHRMLEHPVNFRLVHDTEKKKRLNARRCNDRDGVS